MGRDYSFRTKRAQLAPARPRSIRTARLPGEPLGYPGLAVRPGRCSTRGPTCARAASRTGPYHGWALAQPSLALASPRSPHCMGREGGRAWSYCRGSFSLSPSATGCAARRAKVLPGSLWPLLPPGVTGGAVGTSGTIRGVPGNRRSRPQSRGGWSPGLSEAAGGCADRQRRLTAPGGCSSLWGPPGAPGVAHEGHRRGR